MQGLKDAQVAWEFPSFHVLSCLRQCPSGLSEFASYRWLCLGPVKDAHVAWKLPSFHLLRCFLVAVGSPNSVLRLELPMIISGVGYAQLAWGHHSPREVFVVASGSIYEFPYPPERVFRHSMASIPFPYQVLERANSVFIYKCSLGSKRILSTYYYY